ncbi:chymotrypsin inhibitor-like [Augochlora pura]
MSRTVLILLFAAVACIGMSEGSVKDCGDNEVYKECASPCEQKCGEPPSNCLEPCAPAACQCKPLYVRNSEGKCVLPTKC